MAEFDEDDGMTGDELFEKYFRGKRKQPAGTKTGTRQRNAITDDEINICRKAVEKCGNDWKKILGFVVKYKDLLTKHVAETYEIAFKNIDDKQHTKSIRNRLGNIGLGK
ncbi:hypothetical protein AC249_AIPGENE20195 [Exaiptasia diaphana]|nr:hypothetical protein AC249_AIPGENE20195 [Exaiptasia diaphana]